MELRDACRLFRVDRKLLVLLCGRGEFGARVINRRWVLTNPPATEPCIGPTLIADALRCTNQNVRRLCRSGRIRAFRMGNLWRVPMSEASSLIILRMGGFQKERAA